MSSFVEYIDEQNDGILSLRAHAMSTMSSLVLNGELKQLVKEQGNLETETCHRKTAICQNRGGMNWRRKLVLGRSWQRMEGSEL